GARPRPLWVRPKRPLGQRLLGRLTSHAPRLPLVAASLLPLLAGGICYLEPAFQVGDYLEGAG
ncbi:MAG: hypothetical protein AAB285_03835, partial [candidate division NC10 bacterium]